MKQKNKNANVAVTWSCRLLFSAFTFIYLYSFQGEVLSVAQHVFSGGQTSYSLFAGAVIITAILTALQWIVSRLSAMPLVCHAVTYLPSFLILSILTSVNNETYRHFSLGAWTWIAPLLIAAYVTAALLLHRHLTARHGGTASADIAPFLWPNYLILLLMILVSGSIPSTTDVYYYEIKTERLISEGRYEEALLVGRKHLNTNRRLTQLRMYALARTGQLPDKLFAYPQPYGSEGLLILSDTSSVHRVTSADIRHWLGDTLSAPHMSAAAYFNRQHHADTVRTSALADYYLCALLLDKNLDQFALSIADRYTPTDTLPAVYSQAVVLSEHLFGNADTTGNVQNQLRADSLTLARYRDYCNMRDAITSEPQRSNLTRRKFGDTYWWYYDFGK